MKAAFVSAGTAPTGEASKTVMTEPEIVAHIRVAAEALFGDASGSHDWEHSRRVLRLCERIGPSEGADMFVLRIAALLHDIGRAAQDRSNGGVCHAKKGARMARTILEPLAIPAGRRDNILHCIRSHRFRGDGSPESIEAKVLFDADKLDAIGAVGIARAFLFAGEVGARLHNPEVDIEETTAYSREDTGYREYHVKLRKIRERMLTSTGRAMAEDRHAFMVAFFDRFLEEHQGER